MNTAKSTTSRSDNNENDVKGHLVTKSSALCTDSCKLEKQFMIAQNLASHYKRIINAKPSIDTKPPKSMVKSQKARDRLRRDSLNQSKTKKSVVARPRSADGHKYKENLVDSEALNKFRSSTARTSMDRPLSSAENLHRSMFDSMRNATFNRYNESLFNTKTNTNDHNANTSMHSMTQQTDSLRLTNILNELANPSLKAMSRLVSGKNYDVLDNHSHKFKQPQTLFEPRIKIRKGESKLKQTGVYYPPRARPKSSARDSARESLKESARSEKSNTFEDDYEPMTTSRSNINTLNEQQNETKAIPSPRVSPRKKETTIKRSAEKEEELKYLNFIKEVTDDIIARGVCTNRAINNVFEYHIKRQKDKLNEIKMRELLATLRVDIGIPSQDEPNTDIQYSQTILKATNYDDEKHRQKMQNLDSHNEKYLVLDKFGWTTEYESPRKDLYEKSDFEMRRKHSTLEANKKTQAIKSNMSNEFERSQGDLMRNIDSIRKTNRSSSITSSKFDSNSQAKIITDETDNLSPKINRKENKSHFAKPDFGNFGSKKPERKFSFDSTKDEDLKKSPPSSPDEYVKSKSTFDSKSRKQSDSSDIFKNNFDSSFTKKNERSNSAHSQASNKSPLKHFEFKEDRDTKPARKFSFGSDDSDSTIKKSSNQDLRKSPISSPTDFKEMNGHKNKVMSRKQSDESDIFNNKFDNSISKKNERSESIHSQASIKSQIKTPEDKETKPARKFSFGSDDSDSFNQKPSSNNQGLKKSPVSSPIHFKESNNHENKVSSRKQSDASDIFNNKLNSSLSKKNDRSDSIHSQTSNKSLMKTFEFKEDKETKPARRFSFGSDDDEKSEKQMNSNGRKSPSNELKVNNNKENSRKLSDSSEPFDIKPDNSMNKNKERSNSIHSEASTKGTMKTFEIKVDTNNKNNNNNNNKNSNLSQIKPQTRHSSSSDENELQKTYKNTLKRNNSNSSEESGIVNNFNSTIKKNNNESKRSTPDPFEQDFGTEESDNESDNLLKTKSKSKLLATMKPHQTIQNFDQWDNSDTENELKNKSPTKGKVTFSSNKSGDSDDSF